MTSHHDILDQPEAIGKSFAGSLVFHVGLLAAVLTMSWIESANRLLLGDPNGGRMGSVLVNPIASINLPGRTGPVNPVANDTKSAVPTPPVVKPKPVPQEKAPDPKAIELPSPNAARKPSVAAAPPDKFRAQQKDVENQIYTPGGQRANSPQYQTQGGGGVGVGTNSPFGNQFGFYADLLRQQVARTWKTADIDGRIRTAPPVVVLFTLRRDGTVAGVRITQKSGISALDISAQRAIYDAAPFPRLPEQFSKNEAEIEFVFELKR
jgi:periplasmic protein TonB